VLVPDAEGPGRREAIRLAVRDARAAIGSAGGIEELSRSWLLASGALSVTDLGGLLVADELLAELVLLKSAPVVERIAEHRLHALTALTPAARERMERTALAFVQMHGNAAAMARALHVHPQTARYRIARLRELLGPQLQDPDARFELEAALRHRLEGAVRARDGLV
jgi:DNA-binding PucR family transcriptional regulator